MLYEWYEVKRSSFLIDSLKTSLKSLPTKRMSVVPRKTSTCNFILRAVLPLHKITHIQNISSCFDSFLNSYLEFFSFPARSLYYLATYFHFANDTRVLPWKINIWLLSIQWFKSCLFGFCYNWFGPSYVQSNFCKFPIYILSIVMW